VSRAEFELQTVPEGTAVEVTVTGEVDASNVVDFDRALREVAGERPMIVHLSSMKYLDSAGFAVLDRLLAEQEIVIVLSPKSFMYRVAELMCMPIHHDAKAARQVLRNGAG
jgi:anti-anti-sigma factor